jgi:hypothetical protein
MPGFFCLVAFFSVILALLAIGWYFGDYGENPPEFAPDQAWAKVLVRNLDGSYGLIKMIAQPDGMWTQGHDVGVATEDNNLDVRPGTIVLVRRVVSPEGRPSYRFHHQSVMDSTSSNHKS